MACRLVQMDIFIGKIPRKPKNGGSPGSFGAVFCETISRRKAAGASVSNEKDACAVAMVTFLSMQETARAGEKPRYE